MRMIANLATVKSFTNQRVADYQHRQRQQAVPKARMFDSPKRVPSARPPHGGKRAC
jgi:hypothetical protein